MNNISCLQPGASVQIPFRKGYREFTQPPIQSQFSVAVSSLGILYLIAVKNSETTFHPEL